MDIRTPLNIRRRKINYKLISVRQDNLHPLLFASFGMKQSQDVVGGKRVLSLRLIKTPS
jgi:hypothetical protein